MPFPSLVLASGSPRRRELLTEAGYPFRVIAPEEDVECGICSETSPAGLVADLAFRKAANVVRRISELPPAANVEKASRPSDADSAEIVVGADTVAECGGMILGKPRDETHARAMLLQLSGREHRVLTGVCVWRLGDPQPLVRVAVTKLRMDALSDAQLDEYLASGAWDGKAGAFGYQDRLGWVHIIDGSESNVVGLPIELLAQMLTDIGS